MKHEAPTYFTSRRRCLPTCLASLCIFIASLLSEGFMVKQQRRQRLDLPPVAAKISQGVSTHAATKLAATSSQNKQDNKSKTQRRNATNKRTALKWVVQSIERYAEDPKSCLVDRPSPKLLDALYRLQQARTQRQVAEAGRLLESLDVSRTESIEVQERVMKACSISGLLALALDLLDGFIEKETLPSSIAYVSVCNSLRKAGRVQRLEQLISQLGSIAAKESVSVTAFNIFLAALCDNIEDPARLEHARDWLRPGVSRERLGGTDPDVASYSTVLNAAATMGNRRMVNELWEELTNTRKLQPTIYAYNSLLRSVRSGPDGDTQALDLFDRLLKEVQPDRYTIDLLLVPLIRAKRIGDVEALLGNFVESHSVDMKTASNAFAAFLNSLVKAGELPTARAILDTYLLPSLSTTSDPALSIRPTTRHFNLLIGGYKHNAESDQSYLDEDELREKSLVGTHSLDPKEDESCDARDNGRDLYNTMLDAEIKPDAYTLTSMLGLSSSSAEVTHIFREAVSAFGVEVTPAVARAAITAYGNLCDPSSACIAFDELAPGTMNARTWNALLSALARSALIDNSTVIHINASTSAFALVDSNDTNVVDRRMCKLVHGKSCYNALWKILSVMERNGDESVNITQAPSPNSQTFCIIASALQTGRSNSDLAMELFRNATRSSFSADGRFINAIFRCFGDDIDGAISAWKNEIRRSCLAHEHRRRPMPPSSRRKKGKNLIASYHGLLYVCGRALRPDVAVRLVYAMNKEGLEPTEMALNCYRSGKRMRQRLAKFDNSIEEKSGIGLAMSKQFESILTVECTKYDTNDKRRAGEKRVRIII